MSESLASRLQLENISKRFGATQALKGVSLKVLPGSVHAVIGENGAGKSTLMKILAGALKPDTGSIKLEGNPFQAQGPAEARQGGISMIYQELTLAPDLSVAENMFLGIEPKLLFGCVDRGQQRKKVKEALAFLGHSEISPDTPVSQLSISSQQLVEVGRALVGEAKVIIFDEPTSSLTRIDTQKLFEVIARLRDRGVSILYISHFLEEVTEISDHYSILRDGEAVAHGNLKDIQLDKIIELMVGRSVEEMFPRREREIGEVVLTVDHLVGDGYPQDVSFELRRGEILGIAGLVGSGRTEMLRTLFGLDSVWSGKVSLKGHGEIQGQSPQMAIQRGIGLLSEDRKEEGLLTNLSIADNLTLSDYKSISSWGWVDEKKQIQSTQRRFKELRVKAREPRQVVGDLSGGNQQKVAIGRLVHQDADIVLLDEPTRGVDVGSKVQIYEWMGELAARGKAIIFVSSYLPELLGVADRIAVMNRGRLSTPQAVEELTEEEILRLAVMEQEAH